LPITRDYMAEAEKRLRLRKNGVKKGPAQARRTSSKAKEPA
jgi:hypothetical protein